MAEMRELWRLEQNGYGPFNHETKWLDTAFRAALLRRFKSARHRQHKGPTIDLYEHGGALAFGCSTQEELIAYFGKLIIKMAVKRGFRIVCWHVPADAVIEGKGEIAVKRSVIYKHQAKRAEAELADFYSVIRSIFGETSTN